MSNRYISLQGYPFPFMILDELPNVDDLFYDEKNHEYGTVESINHDNGTLIVECECGMCSLEDRIIPIKNCRRLIPVAPQNN